MVYRFNPSVKSMVHTIERHSHSKIGYFSKQKMYELYCNYGFMVIGEIGNFAKRYDAQDVIVTEIGEIIPIFPRGSLKKPFEWVAGYAAVEKDTYVAVVKSVIPRLIRCI